MNKLKQASEKEKKQERENMRSSYQEAMPASGFYLTFQWPVFKNVYPKLLVQQIIQRSSNIFQPPKIVLQQA